MQKKHTVICFTFFICLTADASVMREDINTQDYRDFGENLGKYTPGAKNIAVYKSDGSLAGLLNFPMPDFGVSDSLGISTLISPSYLAGVRHNGGYKNVVFGNNAKYSTTYNLIARNDYQPVDFHAPRLNKVVTESAAIAYVTREELKDTDRYTRYTRMGSGIQYKVDAETQTRIKLADAYLWRAGGTLPAPRFSNNYLMWTTYAPENPLVTPLDGGAFLGDSGSPVLVYDNLDKIWKLASITVAISGDNLYGLVTHSNYIQDEFVQQIIAGNSDPDITDVSESGQIHWGASSITQGITSWTWHGVSSALPSEATNEELDASKDIRFNGEGGTLLLDQAVNLGAGKLQFSSDYQVSSAEGAESTWVGGGIEVDSGKTVLWQVNGLADDALHKIGAGTLQVNATGINQGSLNTGDGTVILDQQADADGNKQAFSSITLVSGRPTVVLNDAEQVATENILFGYRGGTLDLNGNDLTFKVINHTDSGATLVNHNTTKAASLTLTGYEDNPLRQFNQQVFRGFLGGSEGESETQGELNVNVDVAGSSALVALTGGMNLSDLNVKQGTVLLSGQPVPHAGGVVIDDDWATAIFSANQISVSKESTLQVGEYALVKADIAADEGSHVMLGYNTSSDDAEKIWRCYSVINTDTTSCSKPVRSAVEEDALPASAVSGDITLGKDASLYLGNVYYQGAITAASTSTMTLDPAAFWQVTANSSAGSLKALPGSQLSLLADENTTWTPTVLNLDSLDANGLTISLAASPATEQSDKVAIKDSATGSSNILDISVLTEASEAVKLLTDLVLLDAPGGTAHDYFTVPAIARGFSLFTPNYQVIEEDGRVRWVLAHNAEPDPIPDPDPAPDVDPVPDPDPIPDTDPAPDPDPIPDTDPVPDPDPIPDTDPVPDPDPIPDTDPVPDTDPIPDTDPVPDPDPIPDTDPAPNPDPIPDPVPDEDPAPNPDPAPDVDPIPDPDPTPDGEPAPEPEPAPDTDTPVTPSEPSGWFTVDDNKPLIRGTRALLASRQYLVSEAIGQLQGRASLLRVAPEKSGEWASIEHNKGSFQGVEITQHALNLGWDTVVGEHMFGISAGYAQGTTKGHGKGTHHLTSIGVDYGWSSPQGWFLDAASRYMYLSQDLSFDPLIGIQHGKVNSHILAASVKSGYQFRASENSLFISPYVGLSGGYLPGYGLEGDYARIDLSSSTPYYATAGLEVKKRGLWESSPSLMVTAGVEYQYSPGSAGSSVTLSDSESSRTFSAWSDNRLRVQAGVEGDITDNLSVDMKGRTSFGGNFRTDYSGIAGINYHF